MRSKICDSEKVPLILERKDLSEKRQAAIIKMYRLEDELKGEQDEKKRARMQRTLLRYSREAGFAEGRMHELERFLEIMGYEFVEDENGDIVNISREWVVLLFYGEQDCDAVDEEAEEMCLLSPLYAETLEEARYTFKELLQTKGILFEDEKNGEISVTLPSGREVSFLVSEP